MKKLTLYQPLYPFTISQPFGRKLDFYTKQGMLGHNGLDCVRAGQKVTGALVRSAHEGTVSYTGMDINGGYGVVVNTFEPFEYKDGSAYFKTIYWHLQPNIIVKVGQKVKIGTVLAYADTTGASEGPHLHFGLKPIAQNENQWAWYNIEQKNGYLGAIDPMPYLMPISAYEFITAPPTPQEKETVSIPPTKRQYNAIIMLLLAMGLSVETVNKIPNWLTRSML